MLDHGSTLEPPQAQISALSAPPSSATAAHKSLEGVGKEWRTTMSEMTKRMDQLRDDLQVGVSREGGGRPRVRARSRATLAAASA
jgi:hypothetical protein